MELFVTGIILPCFVAFITTLLFKLYEIREKRKMYNLLGAEILTILIDEIDTGYKIIKYTIDLNIGFTPELLPNKSWKGIGTISEEILLRIYEVSKSKSNIKHDEKNIRLFCQNYFEYNLVEWNNATQDKKIGGGIDYFKKYFYFRDETKYLLEMLIDIKTLLEKNAK